MSINRIVLVCRITADPELKYTNASGLPVCSFSVAVDRPFRAGEAQETDFIPVVAWRKTAEFAANNFRKGDTIAVDGRLQTRSYVDRTQTRRVAYEVIADSLSFTGGRRERRPDEGDHYAPPPGSAERSAPPSGSPPAKDDMPFGAGFRSDEAYTPDRPAQQGIPQVSDFAEIDNGYTPF